jgi:hypothetical protein
LKKVTRHRRNPTITLFLPTISTPSACRKRAGVGGRCPEPLAKEVSLAILCFFVKKSVLIFLHFATNYIYGPSKY